MAKRKYALFVPDMADCKMIVRTEEATCYIMDTCCKNMTREDKLRVDQQILDLAISAELKRLERTAMSKNVDNTEDVSITNIS